MGGSGVTRTRKSVTKLHRVPRVGSYPKSLNHRSKLEVVGLRQNDTLERTNRRFLAKLHNRPSI